MSPLVLVPTDRAAVTRMVEGMAEVYGESLTDARIVGYVELLADIPLTDLKAGMQRAMRACTWFPKPAEIRRAVDAVLASRQVTAQIEEQVVPDTDGRVAVTCVTCNDTGWQCHITGGPRFARASDAELAAVSDLANRLTLSPCPCAAHNPTIRKRLSRAQRRYAEDQP